MKLRHFFKSLQTQYYNAANVFNLHYMCAASTLFLPRQHFFHFNIIASTSTKVPSRSALVLGLDEPKIKVKCQALSGRGAANFSLYIERREISAESAASKVLILSVVY
jgi:hypothetical protein